MSWKYQSNLEKISHFSASASVHIYCDDWDLYERLVKVVEKEINGDKNGK